MKLARNAAMLRLLVVVVLAAAFAFAIQAWIVKPYSIPSQSMEPTLVSGQRVLVDRLGNDFFAPSIGDIVVFHPPAGAAEGTFGLCGVKRPRTAPCPLPAGSATSINYVKRVVAVGGDTIAIVDGHVILNGIRQKEPFATFQHCVNDSTCSYPTPIKVPAGYYFMMGDNRADSDDSRFWGPVPRSWIVGEVFVTYWPLDRIGFF
ncbi:MAG: signal peptidase I [Solirubrobacteraceae bacterium]